MKTSPDRLQLPWFDDEDEPGALFATMVDMVAEGNVKSASQALRSLGPARLGRQLHRDDRPRRLRERDEAVFWFVTMDLVATHGKWFEVAKVQRRLARLGWIVSRIVSRPNPRTTTWRRSSDELRLPTSCSCARTDSRPGTSTCWAG